MDEYKVTNIYFIECVDDREGNAIGAKSLYDDLVSKLKYIDKNADTDYFQIDKKSDFLKTLDKIYEKSIDEKRILIHILHGSEEGLQTNDKEVTSWEEIINRVRNINIKSNNGLFLVLANCYGSYIGKDIGKHLDKISPFNTIISSRYEEKVGDIYKIFEEFYQKLLSGANVFNAFLKDEENSNNKFYIKYVPTLVAMYLIYQKRKYGNDKVLKSIEEKIYNNFLFDEDKDKVTRLIERYM